MLSQISPLQSSNIIPFSEGIPMELTGTGVIVGTIDTGIDYLNKEFAREDGSSRILSIWDQTNNDGHSTQYTGIIGARGYSEVKGVAPNCDFICVKLRLWRKIGDAMNSFQNGTPVYRNCDIATAMLYLIQQHYISELPMVIFLPVNGNLGSHNSTNVIEELED